MCVCDNIRHISYCKLKAKKSLVATELRTEEGLLVSASSLRAGRLEAAKAGFAF